MPAHDPARPGRDKRDRPQRAVRPTPGSRTWRATGEPSELYFNRELSWLDFNDRVLQLAEDDQIPLLERVKFLAIYASNLDEFFMVRVAGVHDQIDAGVTDPGSDGLTPTETIDAIADRVRDLERRRCRVFERELEPALAEAGVAIKSCEDCTEQERETAYRRFRSEIFPVLTPLAVGPGRPFPYISNLSLSVAVRLRDHTDETEAFARVKVPKEMLGALPRGLARRRSSRWRR